jgi:hypothetical protein
MKHVDFNQFVLNIRGEQMQIPGTERKLTYRELAVNALTATYEGEALPIEARLFRHHLADRINAGTDAPVTLNFSEAALIYELASRIVQTPSTIARLAHLFEYEHQPDKD